MIRPLAVLLSSFLMLTIGCSLFLAKETRYLREVQGRATQEEVRQQLGTPRSIAALEGGGAVWLYEIREIEPMSQSTWSSFGSWCDEYRLMFDREGILRSWTHESYAHGGELMPDSCSGKTAVQKPAL